MKFLEKLLDKMEPDFLKGGKKEKWMPLFDGFATFLFVPKHTTKKGVHVRDAVDLKRTMNTVIMALLPCLLFGIWNTGFQHYKALGLLAEFDFLDQVLFGAWQVLPIVVVSYVVGLGVEFAFALYKGHSIEEGFLVSGMLIPLIVPADTPLWMVGVATAFAVVFGKEVFGGTGMNILNPALVARAFLFFAYPKQLSGDKAWVNTDLPDGYTADAGAVLNALGEKVGQIDAMAGATQLSRFNATIGIGKENGIEAGRAALSNAHSVWDSFIGIVPGSIGETSVIAILMGAGLLLLTRVASWRVMVAGIAGAAAMTLIFNTAGAGVNAYMDVTILQHLTAGGFMFGLVYMATDPVSAAQTVKGKFIYGFLIGMMAIMIRVFNPAYPEGMMLAILFMNVMAPLIDHYIVEGNIKKRLSRVKAKGEVKVQANAQS